MATKLFDMCPKSRARNENGPDILEKLEGIGCPANHHLTLIGLDPAAYTGQVFVDKPKRIARFLHEPAAATACEWASGAWRRSLS